MNSGFLYYKSTDFRPDIDLSVYPINPILDLKGYFHTYYYNKNGRNFNELTKTDLRILRNLPFALLGYEFKSKDLFEYFSKFDWYIPDPNIKEEQIELNKWDKTLIDEIQKEELKRQ
jgi:hypothetical protein